MRALRDNFTMATTTQQPTGGWPLQDSWLRSNGSAAYMCQGANGPVNAQRINRSTCIAQGQIDQSVQQVADEPL
eukprot:6769800-Alexandrium_andersonii.AAC.1